MNFADPYPLYAALRAHGPYRAEQTGEGLWVLSSYRDVAAALLEPELVSSPQGTAKRLVGATGPHRVADNVRRLLSQQIEVMNGPPHQRVRALVNLALAQLARRELEDAIRPRVRALIDGLRKDSGVDFVSSVAVPLPREVLLDVLGLEHAEREMLSVCVGLLLATLREDNPNADDIRAAETGVDSIVEHCARWIGRYSSQASRGLMSHLVRASIAGDRLTPHELAANVVLLFAAGHGTTTSLLTNSVYMRLLHPDAAPAQRHDDRCVRFVEETLRFESPIQSVRRTARAHVSIGSASIEPDDDVLILLGAANRDPQYFDAPDVFAPESSHRRHLAFGIGPHRCPGAGLARVQARLLIESIERDAVGLQLDTPAADWVDGASYRGLQSMHVCWKPEA